MTQPAFDTTCACGGGRFRRIPGLRMRTCEVVRCRDCGLLRTFPEPQPEALATIYDATTSAKYTLERDHEHVEIWTGFAREMLDTIERHVAPGRLLDIGCDQAIALVEARKRGWEVEGAELNSAVAHAVTERTGITVHDEPLEELTIPSASFDAIICNQVIEHLADPAEAIAKIRDLLRPGGAAFIGTPCFTAPIGTLLLRDRWFALVPSEHYWQFGPRSLRRLIEASGLRVVNYERGCTKYWGPLPRSPKRMARWLVFRSVALARQGDFLNYVAQR